MDGSTSLATAPKKDYRTEFHLITKHPLKSSTTTSKEMYGHVYVQEGAGKRALIDLCIERSREEDKTVFFVVENRNPGLASSVTEQVTRIGYLFPQAIYDRAFAQVERRLKRVDQISERTRIANLPEPKTNQDRMRAVKEIFPFMPEKAVQETVASAWQKKKVGTAVNVPLGRRVQLAVCAHVRHRYTDYDRRLNWYRANHPQHQREALRSQARRDIEPRVLDLMKKWRGEDDEEIQETWREIIVLDDDNDDYDDSDSQIPPPVTTPPHVEHAGVGPVIYDEDGNELHLTEGATPLNLEPGCANSIGDSNGYPVLYVPAAPKAPCKAPNPDIAVPSIERTHSLPLNHPKPERIRIIDLTRVHDSGRITKRQGRRRSRLTMSAASAAARMGMTHSDGFNVVPLHGGNTTATLQNNGTRSHAPLMPEQQTSVPAIGEPRGMRSPREYALDTAAEPHPSSQHGVYSRPQNGSQLGPHHASQHAPHYTARLPDPDGYQSEPGSYTQGSYHPQLQDQSYQQPPGYGTIGHQGLEQNRRDILPYVASAMGYTAPADTVLRPKKGRYVPDLHGPIIDLT